MRDVSAMENVENLKFAVESKGHLAVIGDLKRLRKHRKIPERYFSFEIVSLWLTGNIWSTLACWSFTCILRSACHSSSMRAFILLLYAFKNGNGLKFILSMVESISEPGLMLPIPILSMMKRILSIKWTLSYRRQIILKEEAQILLADNKR